MVYNQKHIGTEKVKFNFFIPSKRTDDDNRKKLDKYIIHNDGLYDVNKGYEYSLGEVCNLLNKLDTQNKKYESFLKSILVRIERHKEYSNVTMSISRYEYNTLERLLWEE